MGGGGEGAGVEQQAELPDRQGCPFELFGWLAREDSRVDLRQGEGDVLLPAAVDDPTRFRVSPEVRGGRTVGAVLGEQTVELLADRDGDAEQRAERLDELGILVPVEQVTNQRRDNL